MSMGMPSTRTLQTLLSAVIAGVAAANSASAQVEDHHVVRVTTTDASNSGQSATGFLWGSNSTVVTSLHGVLHSRLPGRKIEVFCRGIPTDADVSAVLREADLVLLTTRQPVEGCKVFSDTFPGDDGAALAASLKPPPRTPLYTLGWKGAATTVTYRDLKKGKAGDPETVAGLVTNDETMKAIAALGMPALDLDVYFVTGDGLGGGYSGAPVVDDSGRLLGIVDGGLDKGASDYNWLVPAAFLAELEAKGTSEVPDVDLKLLEAHFSAGMVAPAGAQTEVVFAPQPDLGSTGSLYQFVKTKTRSLDRLASTADPDIADGIWKLVLDHEGVIGAEVALALQFDIFEDVSRGLIIAVPSGQGLVDGPLENHPDVHQLRSQTDTPGDGYITYREQVPDSEGFQTVAVADDNSHYYPIDEGYFNAYVQETIRNCWRPCELHDPAPREIRFLNGDKILTFGVYFERFENMPPYYSYYSVAVRDNIAFVADVGIAIWDDDEGLFQCATMACSNTPTALKQFSQLVSAQLTTFASER